MDNKTSVATAQHSPDGFRWRPDVGGKRVFLGSVTAIRPTGFSMKNQKNPTVGNANRVKCARTLHSVGVSTVPVRPPTAATCVVRQSMCPGPTTFRRETVARSWPRTNRQSYAPRRTIVARFFLFVRILLFCRAPFHGETTGAVVAVPRTNVTTARPFRIVFCSVYTHKSLVAHDIMIIIII